MSSTQMGRSELPQYSQTTLAQPMHITGRSQSIAKQGQVQSESKNEKAEKVRQRIASN
jgi:hypothetical protein